MKYQCKQCESSSITRSAKAEWQPNEQRWKIIYFENDFECQVCGNNSRDEFIIENQLVVVRSPFNLEAARSGMSVCTRSGLDVTNVIIDDTYLYWPVRGRIEGKKWVYWSKDGNYLNANEEHDYDLFMKVQA